MANGKGQTSRIQLGAGGWSDFGFWIRVPGLLHPIVYCFLPSAQEYQTPRYGTRLSGSAAQVALADPLTRPAPAEESAGCGPPSPPRGRGLHFLLFV
jgi:hypothetical protein